MTKKKILQNPDPTFNPKTVKAHPWWGILILIVAVPIIVALADFDPQQSSLVTTDGSAKNLVGDYGAMFAFWSIRLLGISAWVIPMALFWVGFMLFCKHIHQLKWGKWVLLLVLFCSSAALATALQNTALFQNTLSGFIGFSDQYYNKGFGGFIGDLVYRGFLGDKLGVFGSFFIPLVLFLFSFAYLTNDNIGSHVFHALKEKTTKLKSARAEKTPQPQEEVEPVENTQQKVALDAPKPNVIPKTGSRKSPRPPPELKTKTKAEPEKTLKPLISEPEQSLGDGSDILAAFGGIVPAGSKSKITEKAETPPVNPQAFGLKIIASETIKKAKSSQPKIVGDYQFPHLDLLEQEKEQHVATNENEHQSMADLLVRILDEFGVKVTMGEVHTGPVITRYDVYPAAGVRVEKIQNLDKNIALGLKAMSVRILAPVPGKGCVGIEVPNRHPSPVGLREILESETWVESKSEIPIALGKEVSGRPLVADLSKMPHLLIAGATGAGKTVCINAIIASLLYHFSPDDLRFVMVDPKIVEMQGYNDLPHMLIPVVTDPKKVPAALKYLINEMQNRYKIFAKLEVRNIAGFNAKQAKTKSSNNEKDLEADLSPEERAAVSTIEVHRDEEIEIPEKLPYIVCIVDELADLMMVAPADVETSIARLAQLARAAGIHLIIATQRPSVNVITGVIKANLPSRISFKVASKVDSRTILDGNGADQLIGRGDMLFLPPGTHDFVRSQGAFVSDDEITGLVSFLKKNGPPRFDEVFRKSVDEGIDGENGDEEDGGETDDLLPDAIEVLRTTKRASTSMLQRRLRIGYNRAARIMEILEDRGYVGPGDGAQPREILRDLDSL